MASSEVVTLLLTTAQSFLAYMMPVIAMFAGITFIVSWFMNVVFGIGRRTFRG
jgi:hypothetical protein